MNKNLLTKPKKSDIPDLMNLIHYGLIGGTAYDAFFALKYVLTDLKLIKPDPDHPSERAMRRTSRRRA